MMFKEPEEEPGVTPAEFPPQSLVMFRGFYLRLPPHELVKRVIHIVCFKLKWLIGIEDEEKGGSRCWWSSMEQPRRLVVLCAPLGSPRSSGPLLCVQFFYFPNN
jgi:hypothetical protein